jgi:hypothetical protein
MYIEKFTSSSLEPATFRLAAQYQYATACPARFSLVMQIKTSIMLPSVFSDDGTVADCHCDVSATVSS